MKTAKRITVLVIHGGTSFKTYAKYINYLKKKELSIRKLKPQKDWKFTLQKKLGKRFDVLQPRMPNAQNARYSEWKIWFEKAFPLLQRRVILVGHSLGGLFLAKYLSENTLPKKIAALILIAAPYSKADKKEDPRDFATLGSLRQINEQSDSIVLFHSKDDPVVSVSEAYRFKDKLPKAQLRILSNRQHFSNETFPELISVFKKVANKKRSRWT